MFDRRVLLAGLGASAAALAWPSLPARAQSSGAGGERFSRAVVVDAAKRLAGASFEPPEPVPDGLLDLDYDLYRQIRFRQKDAIWGTSPTPFSIQLFAPGFLFRSGVDVLVVESGVARPIAIRADSFETPSPEIGALIASLAKFAGFRLHYPLNRADYRDEFIVFQGASYFRAVSRDQSYGLSARGLAIDTAEADGEEFPTFRRFWIERPDASARAIVVHALLDSPRVAGAYRFAIYPGSPTTVDVDATLFARAALDHVGLGALTSMFLYGPVDGPDTPDYRGAVHDSLGLAIHTGSGERIWRPLQNPKALQVSAFLDTDPKGFGLVQRTRDFADFEDLEARYERRPSAWVAPRGMWGEGHVQLVEIPSDSEINDNIVAYWRPARPIEPGVAFDFSYRLTWPDAAPPQAGGSAGQARVVRSAYGRSLIGSLPQFAIDYAGGSSVPTDALAVDAQASQGRIVETVVHDNPEIGGLRIFLTVDPGAAAFSELRLRPHLDGQSAGETWLFRWLRDGQR